MMSSKPCSETSDGEELIFTADINTAIRIRFLRNPSLKTDAHGFILLMITNRNNRPSCSGTYGCVKGVHFTPGLAKTNKEMNVPHERNLNDLVCCIQKPCNVPEKGTKRREGYHDRQKNIRLSFFKE